MFTNTNRGKDMITEKKTMLLAMIGTSAIIIIGFILKDMILLVATLAVIELFIAIITETTGVFKDRLSKKEEELAKLLDIKKLKDIQLIA